MNEHSRRTLTRLVETVLAPVRASRGRKRRMREELLAHAAGVLEEEVTRLGDSSTAAGEASEEAALRATIARLGSVGDLTREFQQAVTAGDRLRAALETVLALCGGVFLTWVCFRIVELLTDFALQGWWHVDVPLGLLGALGMVPALTTGLLLVRSKLVARPFLTIPLVVLVTRLPGVVLSRGLDGPAWWGIFSYDLCLALVAWLGCRLARRTSQRAIGLSAE